MSYFFPLVPRPLARSLSLAIATCLLSTSFLPLLPSPEAIAAPRVSATSRRRVTPKRNRVNFRVGVKASRYRVGGFSRNSLCGVGKETQALVPAANAPERLNVQNANGDFVEQTLSDRPTFFIYMPNGAATRAKMTVQNEARTQQLDSVSLNLGGKSGVIGIPMSATAKPLQVGQKYLWQMTVYCDIAGKMPSVTVSGWVERVAAPALSGNLQERAAFLAEQGIWQDAVLALAQLRQQQPQNSAIAADWQDLMTSAGLPALSQAPIAQIGQ
ncbi:MAG: DUF928 domain-containing protein [Synechococcales bacterium]|nr:DUF928 domain-containing protein [Synechococcales bacterium]